LFIVLESGVCILLRKMDAKTTLKHKQSKQKTPHTHTRRYHWVWKWLLGILGTILVLIVALLLSFKISPWPGALLIRSVFNKGGTEMAQSLKKHEPSGITEIQNQQYRQGDKDAYLDVFYPEHTTTALPTIVWVHGGAWVSGNKDEIDGYLKILADRGYTAVGINYSIAPEKKYPVPIVQLNEALEYLQQEAPRLHIDPHKIVLAGDSAGSQIVAQMANIITSPSYANELGISPTLSADRLRALVLNCGAYDLDLPDYNAGLSGWFLHTVLWAYSGKKDFLHDPALKHASVVDYVTPAFPPTFLTAGNADPLENQSKEMVKKLGELGVPTSMLFFPDDHMPQLPHEYQFNLDNDDGKQALTEITDFLQGHTK
jgi:acetyl esterase